MDKHSKADEFNREAWEHIAEQAEYFHLPTGQDVEAARNGEFKIKLTATKNVPSHWWGDLKGKSVLLLAGGGGQQSPLLAAAGASVTVFDCSQTQLRRDSEVAAREELEVKTVVGDMRDLGVFANEQFDLVVNPTAICYVSEAVPVWKEVFRVLVPGGYFLAGMHSPVNFLFDPFERDEDKLVVRNKIPYCDTDLNETEQEMLLSPTRPIEFSHTLTDLLGGQMEAGFQLVDLYTDRWGDQDAVSDLIDVFLATRCMKP